MLPNFVPIQFLQHLQSIYILVSPMDDRTVDAEWHSTVHDTDFLYET